jgi:hypothetical protein
MERRTREQSRRKRLHGKSATPAYLSVMTRGCAFTNLT